MSGDAHSLKCMKLSYFMTINFRLANQSIPEKTGIINATTLGWILTNLLHIYQSSLWLQVPWCRLAPGHLQPPRGPIGGQLSRYHIASVYLCSLSCWCCSVRLHRYRGVARLVIGFNTGIAGIFPEIFLSIAKIIIWSVEPYFLSLTYLPLVPHIWVNKLGHHWFS